MGATGGAFRTELELGDEEVELEESTVLVSATWRPSTRLGLLAGVGAILGGTLRTADGVAHDVDPGVAASVAASWLALFETELRPFVMLGASLSASRASTDGDGTGLTAGDLRLSVLVGKTFADVVTPYAVVRGFAGPVAWDARDEVGSDVHHYAIGAGATLRLPGDVDAFVEGVPLGERSLSSGVGLAF